MGHNKVTTTLGIYAHLFEDDHADAMAAMAAQSRARQTSYGYGLVPGAATLCHSHHRQPFPARVAVIPNARWAD
jgi:hypothetical protein